MDFQEWSRAVDSVLKSNQRGVTVAELDGDALEEAYQGGISPVIFAKGYLPRKVQSDPVGPLQDAATTILSSHPIASVPGLVPRRLLLIVVGLLVSCLAWTKFGPVSDAERAQILNFVAKEYGEREFYFEQRAEISRMRGLGGAKAGKQMGEATVNVLKSLRRSLDSGVPRYCGRLADLLGGDLDKKIVSGLQEETFDQGPTIYNEERDTERTTVLQHIGMSDQEFLQLARHTASEPLNKMFDEFIFRNLR